MIAAGHPENGSRADIAIYDMKTRMNGYEREPPNFVALYRLAFAEYGTRALWNKRRLRAPTPQDALVIARALRIEGDRRARCLAEEIERACRAAI
jgi:hypothetical protein